MLVFLNFYHLLVSDIIYFFKPDCLTIKTKQGKTHLFWAKIILDKQKSATFFLLLVILDKLGLRSDQCACDYPDCRHYHTFPVCVFVRGRRRLSLIHEVVIQKCHPVNSRPIKRRLLSWQLPGEQMTDVRARMIAWSEDT